MYSRVPAGALLFLVLLAGCEAGQTTASSDLNGPGGIATQVACPSCTFEPQVYTRGTSIPVTEVVEFPGDPAGAYTIEISDLGTRGANASVELNGEPLNVRSGYLEQDVVLDWENTLHVRLTGKPGSKLSVRVFQEVASVEVTPDAARSRIAATLQFTAVAKDRNGVEIPRQTFTWESGDVTIATVGAATGLASTTGMVHNMAAWNYKTIRTGEGMVAIVARADGSPTSGSATWTVVPGFVYTTYQAALPKDSPNRASRPASVPYHYDVPRLQSMTATCDVETQNTAWRPQLAGVGERQFKQCYPRLETETPTRYWVPATPFTPGYWSYVGSDNNVGLYGRYCGGGQPAEEWWDLAWQPGYQPKDPTDALCMEHDRSEDLHEIPASNLGRAACIVRYGIEVEQLHEEGVLVQPGSARWDAFWSAWPRMAESRDHWLKETKKICFGPIYTSFLDDRGLTL
ncbi:MAG TPA: hypothetical protein VFN96_10630 [Gemmatimonadales bacterium]|nr:hypothetical protein [Gemmatimonadales bacterium]